MTCLEKYLKREFKRVEQNNSTVGIVMFNLDLFKEFKENFGDEAGDNLIREIELLLPKYLRNSDIACRYLHDEFILIMPDASLEDTQKVAEIWRQEAKDLITAHRHKLAGAKIDIPMMKTKLDPTIRIEKLPIIRIDALFKIGGARIRKLSSVEL